MLCCFSCFEACLLLSGNTGFPYLSHQQNSGFDIIPRFLPFQSCHLWDPSPKIRYKSWPLCFHIHLTIYSLAGMEVTSFRASQVLSVTGSVGNTAVLVIAEQCMHNVRAFVLLLCLCSGQKAWREHNLHTWHRLAQQGYSMTYNVSNKSWGEGFFWGWRGIAAGLPVGGHKWLPLLFSSSFLHILNYVSPWVFFILFFLFSHTTRLRNEEWAKGYLGSTPTINYSTIALENHPKISIY